MKLEFESPRLFYRPLEMGDIDLDIKLGADADVMKYVGGVESEESIRRNMPKYIRRCGDGCIGIWRIIELESDEQLGWVSLLPLPIDEDDTDWDLLLGEAIPDCEIEVGYVFRKSAWGKGYASEACRRILEFAFEDTPLGEVVAVTEPENTASQHVLQKNGMAHLGIRRAYGEDCTSFRITREQWASQS